MGLDIAAYGGLSRVDAVFDADGEPIDPHTREPLDWQTTFLANVNHDFDASRYEGVDDKGVYTFVGSFHFRAGSYGGYNQWREELAILAGYPEVLVERVEGYAPSASMRRDAAAWQGMAAGMPFEELVNFSDCEGVIGKVTAAKLAKDFAEWDERARTFQGDPWFYERYKDWRKAMEIAADDGAVDFH